MFWGAIIKENQPYVFTKEYENRVFHLSSASLEHGTDTKPVHVYIESKGQKYIACVLRQDTQESMKLDNFLTTEPGLKFSVSNCPKGEVHLTGYYENEELSETKHEQHPVETKKHEIAQPKNQKKRRKKS